MYLGVLTFNPQLVRSAQTQSIALAPGRLSQGKSRWPSAMATESVPVCLKNHGKNLPAFMAMLAEKSIDLGCWAIFGTEATGRFVWRRTKSARAARTPCDARAMTCVYESASELEIGRVPTDKGRFLLIVLSSPQTRTATKPCSLLQLCDSMARARS